MFLVFDTETTGLPKNFNAPVTDLDNWPRCVQLAWQVHDEKGQLVEVKNYIIKPDGYSIPYNAEKIHGISTERANKQGMPLRFVLDEFQKSVDKCEFLVGHNVIFDINVMGAEYVRAEMGVDLADWKSIDTKDDGTNFCAIPGGRGGKFKWPTLTELHFKLFKEGFDEAHNAAADVEATGRAFLEMVRIDVISPQSMGRDEEFIRAFKEYNPGPIKAIGLNTQPYDAGELVESTTDETDDLDGDEDEVKSSIQGVFSHLHVHSQYSVLQSTVNLKALCEQVAADGQPAVGITDHGNMFSSFNFVREANKAGIKAIVGYECYLVEDHTITKFTKDNPDRRSAIPLLALNKQGYHNLAKMSSEGYIHGHYAGYPRISKPVIEQYKEGVVALSGGPTGEIPNLILNVGEEQAEEALLWWKATFGKNFYLELIDHGLDEEKHLNKVLARFAKKHDVKLVATNNVYYVTEKEASAHDLLLCVRDGELKSTPVGRGRGFRYGMPNEEYYLKSQEQMKALFAEYPDAINNIQEIVDQVEVYKLERDILLPQYEMPPEFETQDDYLRHLTYEGAKTRYPEMTDEIRERLDYELRIVKEMGFPGYFLIVQDFTSEARKMGVWVGPGRGSAAGSAVAYAVGITNIDPIKYKLLFERFLNPERVSMPDIDIDFDDEGRGRIIDWVVEKYGKNQVAQIITYGSMAAKSSIRDVGRVMELPLQQTDRLSKLVPDFTTLDKVFNADLKKLGEKLNGEDIVKVQDLRKVRESGSDESDILEQAILMEGSIRNTGIHACGVIITPDDITNYIPVSTARDADLLVTQYDNKVVEDAGMLKMDFLGLKTLTIIKDACRIVKERHGIDIHPDDIPLDDETTFELYQRGETNGTFQFESEGMQKSLRELQPTNIEDLIAMNALYRPGPMDNIPSFVRRKRGDEEILYPHELLKPILEDTYGIMVYQEQIMQTAQILGGYSLGGADLLRRAMGKKKMDIMQEQRQVFKKGAKELHDVPEKQSEEIFDIMIKFAAYGFNRSHAAAYSVVAFHTGYMKANYPAEYMAAVLTNNMSDIKKVTFFMEECKRMGLEILGPDVNESNLKFRVNDRGGVRFGMAAIKGVGHAAVESFVAERTENGPFTSLFDFVTRVDLKTVNKKSFESLVLAGAFDCFPEFHRAQYFNGEGSLTFLEEVLKFANALKAEADAPPDLFGETQKVEIRKPTPMNCTPWGNLEQLAKEKEVVGVYISGHPLDDFKLEMDSFCNGNLSYLVDLQKIKNKEISMAGIVTEAEHRQTKNGKPFGTIEMEDYSGGFKFFLFGEDYMKMKHYMLPGTFLYLKGRAQGRWGNEENLEFKIHHMELLSEVRDKLTKSVTLSMRLGDIDDPFIDTLEGLFEKFKGKVRIKLKVQDPLEKISVEMPAKALKVEFTNELIDELKELGITYQLN